MKIRHPILIVAGLGCSAWGFLYRPFPLPGDDPLLDLVLYHTPNFYTWIVWWYYLAPAAAVIVGGLVLISVWRVWFESWGIAMPNIGMLPTWPLNPAKDAGPSIVVGEVHHPVKAVESNNPKWLIIPERGLEDEHHVFAKALVDTGRYASVSAVIQQGIKLLRQCLDVEYLERRALYEVLSRGRDAATVGTTRDLLYVARVDNHTIRRTRTPGLRLDCSQTCLQKSRMGQ